MGAPPHQVLDLWGQQGPGTRTGSQLDSAVAGLECGLSQRWRVMGGAGWLAAPGAQTGNRLSPHHLSGMPSRRSSPCAAAR